MPDYCAECQDATPGESEGSYIEVTNEKHGIWLEVWVCRDCLEAGVE